MSAPLPAPVVSEELQVLLNKYAAACWTVGFTTGKVYGDEELSRKIDSRDDARTNLLRALETLEAKAAFYDAMDKAIDDAISPSDSTEDET